MEWRRAGVEKAAAFLDASYKLVTANGQAARAPIPGSAGTVSRSADKLRQASRETIARVAEYINAYRPNAALELLAHWRKRIDHFAGRRVPTGRISPPDRTARSNVLDDYVIALAPFAPYLAEKSWRALGHDTLACQASWPGSE